MLSRWVTGPTQSGITSVTHVFLSNCRAIVAGRSPSLVHVRPLSFHIVDGLASICLSSSNRLELLQVHDVIVAWKCPSVPHQRSLTWSPSSTPGVWPGGSAFDISVLSTPPLELKITMGNRATHSPGFGLNATAIRSLVS